LEAGVLDGFRAGLKKRKAGGGVIATGLYYKRMASWSAIFAIIVLLLLPSALQATTHQILRIVDGDTIDINYNGKRERVRLLCVNTPESVHPDKKQNVPMGKVAAEYAKGRLSGKSVDLEFEGSRTRGKYGRLLAYVIVDGQNFNLELVRQGLSPYYTKYGKSQKYDSEFKAAEKLARQDGLNIWGDPGLAEKHLRLKSKWGQRVVEERAPPQASTATSYVGSRRSDKFHRPSCRYAGRIKPSNLVVFGSRQEALNAGYVPCKACRP
jgi:micrococcal nuclease